MYVDAAYIHVHTRCGTKLHSSCVPTSKPLYSTPSHKLCSPQWGCCVLQMQGGGVHTCGLATTVEFTLWIVRPYAVPDAP